MAEMTCRGARVHGSPFGDCSELASVVGIPECSRLDASIATLSAAPCYQSDTASDEHRSQHGDQRR